MDFFCYFREKNLTNYRYIFKIDEPNEKLTTPLLFPFHLTALPTTSENFFFFWLKVNIDLRFQSREYVVLIFYASTVMLRNL